MAIRDRRRWPGEIGAHFPINADHITRCRPLAEGDESGRSELKRQRNVGRIASHKGRSAEGVHPFRQIMKILTVAIPSQSLIDWFTKLAFLERLANPHSRLWSDDVDLLARLVR